MCNFLSSDLLHMSMYCVALRSRVARGCRRRVAVLLARVARYVLHALRVRPRYGIHSLAAMYCR